MPNPLHVPIPTRPTPEVLDVLFFEDIDAENAPYVALPYGSEHPDTASFAGFKLCKEEVVGKSVNRRWWATEFVNQDIYNYGIGYDGEDITKPVYPRRYIIRRDKYNATSGPLTKGAAFTGVWMVKVTTAGTGYDPEVPPNVSIAAPPAGVGNSTATARAVVNPTGNVTWIVLTSEGSGYTSAPTVTIAPPTSGTTALATAYIQAATALLTQEKMTELPTDDPRHSIFVQVDRLYETLPGAVLTTRKLGEQGVTETTTVQRLLTGTVPAGPVGGYLVQGDSIRAESTVVDIRERITVPEWPVLTDYDQDPEHLGSIVTTFEIVDASTVTAPTTTAGKIRRYKHIDKWRSMKIVEDFTAFTAITYSEQRFMAFSFPKLLNVLTGYTWSDVCGLFSDQRDGFSAMVRARLDVSFTTTAQVIDGLTIIPKSLHLGHGLQESNVLVDACAACLTYTGECTGSLTFGASDPSRTAYLALVSGATPQLVSGESVRTRFGGLYKNSSLYVLMK